MDYMKLGKEISYVLRHHPEKYDLRMDEEGWVSVEELCSALRGQWGLIEEKTIQDLMKYSTKQRYELKNHYIRAYYGHSFSKKIKKEICQPPLYLYHGTARRFLKSINQYGLLPMRRQYVHLSEDKETAQEVGKRHDQKPILLKIKANEAFQEGIMFYKGNENVWLSDAIDLKYIEIIEDK